MSRAESRDPSGSSNLAGRVSSRALIPMVSSLMYDFRTSAVRRLIGNPSNGIQSRSVGLPCAESASLQETGVQ